MFLDNSINRYLARFLSVVSWFCKTSGYRFSLACAFLSMSRLFQMVAFFLPFKVFLVIYSGEVPEYVSQFFGLHDWNKLSLILSLLVPVFYFACIAFGVLYRRLIDSHLSLVEAAGKEMDGVGFAKKNLRKVHNHVAKAYSDFALVFVALVFSLAISFDVALMLLFLLYVNAWLFSKNAFSAKELDRLTILKLHRRQYIEYISSSNFLIVFCVLAYELSFEGLGIYSAIFLVLLARMVFQALNRFSIEGIYVTRFMK